MTQAEIDHKARLTLENLTPGGSEFHNEPETCEKHIQELIDSGQRAKNEVTRLRRELDSYQRYGRSARS